MKVAGRSDSTTRCHQNFHHGLFVDGAGPGLAGPKMPSIVARSTTIVRSLVALLIMMPAQSGFAMTTFIKLAASSSALDRKGGFTERRDPRLLEFIVRHVGSARVSIVAAGESSSAEESSASMSSTSFEKFARLAT